MQVSTEQYFILSLLMFYFKGRAKDSQSDMHFINWFSSEKEDNKTVNKYIKYLCVHIYIYIWFLKFDY